MLSSFIGTRPTQILGRRVIATLVIIAFSLIGVQQATGTNPDSCNTNFDTSMAKACKALNRCWNPDYKAGIAAVEEALQIARNQFPRFDKRTREALYVRAMASCRSRGSAEQNKSDLYEVLEIDKHNGRPTDSFVCSRLGLVLLQQGRWDEVLVLEENLKQTGELDRQPFELKRTILAQLSEAYAGKQQYANALSKAQEELQLEQDSQQPWALRHYSLVGALKHVSRLLRKQNPPATEKSMDIDKRLPIIGDDLWDSPLIGHPRTAQDRQLNELHYENDLAMRQLCQGSYSQSEKTLSRSIEIHSSSHEKNSALFYPLLTLACVYRLQGRPSDAMRSYSLAEKLIPQLRGDETRFGTVYPQCLASLYRAYGRLLKQTGKLAEAKRCLDLSRQYFEALEDMTEEQRVNSICSDWRQNVMLP